MTELTTQTMSSEAQESEKDQGRFRVLFGGEQAQQLQKNVQVLDSLSIELDGVRIQMDKSFSNTESKDELFEVLTGILSKYKRYLQLLYTEQYDQITLDDAIQERISAPEVLVEYMDAERRLLINYLKSFLHNQVAPIIVLLQHECRLSEKGELDPEKISEYILIIDEKIQEFYINTRDKLFLISEEIPFSNIQLELEKYSRSEMRQILSDRLDTLTRQIVSDNKDMNILNTPILHELAPILSIKVQENTPDKQVQFDTLVLQFKLGIVQEFLYNSIENALKKVLNKRFDKIIKDLLEADEDEEPNLSIPVIISITYSLGSDMISIFVADNGEFPGKDGEDRYDFQHNVTGYGKEGAQGVVLGSGVGGSKFSRVGA